MNNLYEALEVCLEAMEQGVDIETSLARYPDIADELRPILQTSIVAREKTAFTPSADMMRRNRAKFIQHATVMREAMVKPSLSRNWFTSLRRVAVVLAVLAIVFLSGTGLVQASSRTLPGDNLYPVKRTWEDVSLLFTFDLTRRESLEIEHENERLEECYELIAEGRSAEVDFAGIITEQNGNKWLVSGITIVISPQTDFHDGPVFVGDAVRVFGVIQSNDSVLVERVDQLPSGAPLPDIGNSGKGSNSGSGSGNDDNGNDAANENDSSGPGSGNDNSNDNNSGSSSGTDNSNDSNSGPGGGNDNENINNSGSGSGIESGNDNNSGPSISDGSSNEDNSGSGSANTNSNEDNSGSGSGSNNSNEDNSGSGGGGD